MLFRSYDTGRLMAVRDDTGRLMRHGVDDVVDTDAETEGGEFFGVAGFVGELPGVAEIGVEGHGDHDAAFVVADDAPVGVGAVGAVGEASALHAAEVADLVTLGYVEDVRPYLAP